MACGCSRRKDKVANAKETAAGIIRDSFGRVISVLGKKVK